LLCYIFHIGLEFVYWIQSEYGDKKNRLAPTQILLNVLFCEIYEKQHYP
jgi:hypothetical protein